MNELSDKRTEGARHLFDGSARVFFAEALYLPTGLIVTIFLTRWLEPDGYGLFVLAATIVTWVQIAITSFLSSASVRLVSEAEDWRPVGARLLNLHLVLGLAGGLLLLLCAGTLSRWLREPSLPGLLYIFALDIPLFSLAQAHRHLLIGVGKFRQRAWAGSAKWTARCVLVLVCIVSGLSVYGAALGTVGATLVELLIYRWYVRPPLALRQGLRVNRLWKYSLPLFGSAMALMLFERLDLLVMKSLGATTAVVGVYGAAQNLMTIRRTFAISLSPLLVSSVTRMITDGSLTAARKLAGGVSRFVIVLLPLFAAVAASGHEITVLVFGARFSDAGSYVAPLVFGAHGSLLMSINGAILTASGQPALTLLYTAILPPLAFFAHRLAIPWFGSLGAAYVTGSLTYAAALGSCLILWRAWKVQFQFRRFAKSVLIASFVVVLGAYWSAPALLAPLKVAALGTAGVLLLYMAGEIPAGLLSYITSILRRSKGLGQMTRTEPVPAGRQPDGPDTLVVQGTSDVD